ncbi:MAG: hypothetical protein AABM30_04865 [Actinomycetota bacterium]
MNTDEKQDEPERELEDLEVDEEAAEDVRGGRAPGPAPVPIPYPNQP